MLAKAYRLQKDTEIKRLIHSGKTFFLPQMTIKYLFQANSGIKIGFVVSNKIDKRATVRNQLKRRLREAVRKLLPDLKSGYSLLIIAKKSALDLGVLSLNKQLIFALNQIKVYNKKIDKT
ncbi:MAG: ribonuclease P protein component [Patescibacteria group bacterium]